MDKKIAIVLGVIAVVFVLGVVTNGKSWPFIVAGTLAYAIYKNNRFWLIFYKITKYNI